jgi:putative transposase
MAGKRERRGEGIWRAIVARERESGLSVTAFCARERLSAASFYQWRARLREGGAVAKPAEVPVAGGKPVAAAFVDLGALGGSSGRLELRIDLGGGLIVQLARH